MVILEVNMIEHDCEWWLNSEATRHVIFYKNMLKSFQGVGDDNVIYIRNSSTTKVLGQGKVDLNLTS